MRKLPSYFGPITGIGLFGAGLVYLFSRKQSSAPAVGESSPPVPPAPAPESPAPTPEPGAPVNVNELIPLGFRRATEAEAVPFRGQAKDILSSSAPLWSVIQLDEDHAFLIERHGTKRGVTLLVRRQAVT